MTCPSQVNNRLASIAAIFIVTGQFAQMIVELAAPNLFDRRADSLVQLLAALYQNRIVSDLLRQGVLEDKLDLRVRRLLVDEIARPQFCKHLLQLRLSNRNNLPDQVEPRFSTDHRQGLQ